MSATRSDSDATESAARQPLRRKDLLLATAVYAVGVVVALFWAYDLFGKAFDLIRNRCTAQRDFSVQCTVIRPPAQALVGFVIAGGGITLALGCALVLAAVSAVTRRSAWLWPAIALPVIVISGAVGHFLVGGAVG
ncbi:hypothetical protein FOH10_32410 [Nocardia otitidiscaviarum]|uniref:Transmembrane protein n=1 Tax=Nocardia otitidiscaviarum TaxID=1823 RepID=A0A516NUY6_9NOCA|nr:hypothetical protein [Nocardia otitidiscaviarum]MCP9622157.1 hypothetical protein [Nocardia otitidiscaviarum]QDP82730.1 hypothetical protein FOH10_32410 [Nocardia otitidiscaviarum]